MISVLADCPHGTEYGYNEFGCRCLDYGPLAPDPDWPGGPWKLTGCGPIGVRAAAQRRRERRRRKIQCGDSALAQLDQLNAPFTQEHEQTDPTICPSRHLPDTQS